MATNSNNNQENQPINEGWWSRNVIAFIITIGIIGITIGIAWYELTYDVKAGEQRDLSLLSQTLIPLWATWIGTVLAFYFGKANFEAGSKSFQDVLKAQSPDDKIAQKAVKNVMLPVKDIQYLDFDKEQNNTIADILKYPHFEPYNRFAVFDSSKVVKCMIHRGLFYQYIYVRTTEPDANGALADSSKLTLNDLIGSKDPRFANQLQRGIVLIGLEANLLEAKNKMDAVDECNDVFVTQTGKATEPVLGLITNNLILEHAKV